MGRSSWVEYAHSTLVSATGRSPFMAAYGYQPPLFPSQEGQVDIPSIQDHLKRTHHVRREPRAALSRTATCNKQTADCRCCPAPTYRLGQKVWLSTRDLNLSGNSRKLGPRFIGPFEMESIVNPVSIKFRLPPTLKIHPIFHISFVKPLESNPLAPPPTPPLPSRIVDRDPVHTVKEILNSRHSRSEKMPNVCNCLYRGTRMTQGLISALIQSINPFKEF